MFETKYGIDLGNSSVRIYSSLKNKSISEKNMIAARGHNIIAVGDDAYEMFEKQPTDISVISPMAFGAIADVELQEIVLYTMLGRLRSMLQMGSVMYFSVPLNMTAVEKRAYHRVVNGHWIRRSRVYIVEKPIVDAIAIGIAMENNVGSMIINIGSESTELSVIADGKIIISRKIPMGGRHMDEAIVSEVRKRYHLQIGIRTAKRLKLVLGRLNDQKKEARKVVGIDSVTGLPREEVVSSYVVNAGIMNCVNEIASEIKTFLERTPPSIAYHIAAEGVYLTGGSARLPFLENYLGSYTGYTFNQSELYENSSLLGLQRIIQDPSLQKWAVPIKQRKL